MYLTGFADEAGTQIRAQIRATKELGWENIEARKIAIKDGDANIHDISDADFDKACEALDEAGVQINCFGSAVANWGKQITEPFDSSLEETKRAIPRMQRLGTKLIRIMSFAVLKDRESSDQMEEERFRRLRELQKMFADAGIQPVHENCMNYGGMGWTYTLKLIENVPGLKLVFDTGNPIASDDRVKPKPYPRQNAWEFYSHVKEHVAYLHIKDGIWNEEGGKAATTYTFPGEGQGCVKQIIKDMLDSGYEGGISMEPHMVVLHHDEGIQAKAQEMYDNYVEYGKRFMSLIEDIGHGDKIADIKPLS